MGTHAAEQLKHLETAFQTFNQMSEQLMLSYHQLETQVERLNQELVAAHGERLAQLEQKNQLANRLERLLDALPAGVVVLDGKGMVQEVNLAAIELLGEPLKGVSWRNIIQRVFKPRGDDGHDVSLQDGRRVSISTSTLGEEPGQIILINDVTEKRHLEDKLGRFQRLSAMGQMAASLAHQIRTPTASALLYLSSLRQQFSNMESFEKYIDKVRQQLRHIESMVSDMLVYARGGGEVRIGEFSVQQLIDLLIDSVQGQMEQKGYVLNITNNTSDIHLWGSLESLHGALLNLVMNSIQAAGRDNLVVSIDINTTGQHVVVKVADNGIGIPESIISNIFDPFVTTRPQGTGLGLAIVKSIVEKFNGDINVRSSKDVGTTVILTLPVYDGVDNNNNEVEVVKNEVYL